MDIIVRFFLYTVAVVITGYMLPGVIIKNFWTGVIIAAVLSLINAFIKPLMVLLTIPIVFATLGLFLLVINAGLVLLAASLVPGFEVKSFWWALLFSVVLSFFTYLFKVNTGSEFFN
jgi:putative membrane protein